MLYCPSICISFVLALVFHTQVTLSSPSMVDRRSQSPVITSTPAGTQQQRRNLSHQRRAGVTDTAIATAFYSSANGSTTRGTTTLASGQIETGRVTLSLLDGQVVTLVQSTTTYVTHLGEGSWALNATITSLPLPESTSSPTMSSSQTSAQSTLNSSSQLTAGAKAGIGVGAAVGCSILVAMGAFGAIWWLRRSRQKKPDIGSGSNTSGDAKEGGNYQAISAADEVDSASMRRQLATGKEVHELQAPRSKPGELEGLPAQRLGNAGSRYELGSER